MPESTRCVNKTICNARLQLFATQLLLRQVQPVQIIYLPQRHVTPTRAYELSCVRLFPSTSRDPVTLNRHVGSN